MSYEKNKCTVSLNVLIDGVRIDKTCKLGNIENCKTEITKSSPKDHFQVDNRCMREYIFINGIRQPDPHIHTVDVYGYL